MAIDRVNAVHIGHGKDELGFPCSVLEDPDTGARFVSYDVETWWMRCQHLKHLEAIGKRSEAEAAITEIIPVEVKE